MISEVDIVISIRFLFLTFINPFLACLILYIYGILTYSYFESIKHGIYYGINYMICVYQNNFFILSIVYVVIKTYN